MIYLAIDIVDELEIEILYMGTELGRTKFLFERGLKSRNFILSSLKLKSDAPMVGTFGADNTFYAWLDGRGIVNGWGERGLFLTQREIDK